jgi:hypothetical protein
MATLVQIRNKADASLQEFWDVLSVKQEQYFRRYQDYFQLLHTAPVVDGEDTTFVLTLPSDQSHRSIEYVFNHTSPIPYQIAVQCFGNDKMKGYEVTVVVELLDGRKFTRSRTLTDTRTLTQDYDEAVPPNPVGEPYLIGPDPVIETTAWTEIVNLIP